MAPKVEPSTETPGGTSSYVAVRGKGLADRSSAHTDHTYRPVAGGMVRRISARRERGSWGAPRILRLAVTGREVGVEVVRRASERPWALGAMTPTWVYGVVARRNLNPEHPPSGGVPRSLRKPSYGC